MLRFSAESQDGADVIGTIAIDGHRSAIEVESAYLDSWLAGVLDCFAAALRGVAHHEVDLIEESKPLISRALGGQLSLRFGDQIAELGALESAVHEIATDISQLLQRHPPRNEALLGEIESRLRTLKLP